MNNNIGLLKNISYMIKDLQWCKWVHFLLVIDCLGLQATIKSSVFLQWDSLG